MSPLSILAFFVAIVVSGNGQTEDYIPLKGSFPRSVCFQFSKLLARLMEALVHCKNIISCSLSTTSVTVCLEATGPDVMQQKQEMMIMQSSCTSYSPYSQGV